MEAGIINDDIMEGETTQTVCPPDENEKEKDTDWKRRTLELEEQLFLLRERVNSQTGKIRDAVSKRVQAAEECASQAEEKAEGLLKKMQEFEERTLVAENKVTRCYERNQHLEDIIEQKESIIRQLRVTVAEEQSKYNAIYAFEEKVARVKEWVKQILEENQKEIEELKLQIEQKDQLIDSLKNGYSQNRMVRTNSNSSSEIIDRRRPVQRPRSKSAVTISRKTLQISEIVPAVPPRRASLGILNRTKHSARIGIKTKLNSLKECEKADISMKANLSVEKDESNEKRDQEPDIKDEKKYPIYMSLECEPSEIDRPTSKFYISPENEDNNKAVVKITMRERLKQLTQSTEDVTHSSDCSDMNEISQNNNENNVDQLIDSLEGSSHDSNGICSDSEQKKTVTVKLTIDTEANDGDAGKVVVESEPKCPITAHPGTDAMGYTKLMNIESKHASDKKQATEKSSGHVSTFTSYLPPEFILSHTKLDSDSSGCSSLEHTPPMRGSWVQDPKIFNPTVNGLIASEDWKRSSEVDTIHGTPGGFACNLMQVQSCPVYAQLEGIASEIQSRPCTGDSTDSSDNEATEPVNMADGEPAVTGRLKSISVGDRLLRRGSCKKKVLKTCAQYTTINLKSEALQKAGYLSKLGGRIKNWKKRWFVLSETKLSYFKSENDVSKKALGQIPLDGFCGITRTEGSVSFQIDTVKRRYYLTGETVQVIDDWLKVLQSVLRKFMASNPLLAQVNEKAVMKGWVTKVKLGKSRKCYCILRGKHLCYYKGECDQAPFSLLNMKEIHIEKISSVDSEDNLDIDDNEPSKSRFTLRLFNEKQPSTSSTYLLVDNKQDHNAWLYHLTMASGHIDQTGTEFEQTIAKLKEQNSDAESTLWNSTIITHSKEPLENPLTTLPSDELENKALQLFKSIQLFCNAECVPGPAINYHVVYAQNALQMCMANVELREEIYCQLMKQTAKRVHVLSDSADALERFLAPHSEWLTASRTYSVGSDATIDLRPTREGQVLWFLKAHLQRYSSKETVIGKYAKYCQHCLDRTIQNGEREAGPSRMEVIAILSDDPFEHSYPLKIPVHFVNRTSEKFGFDGATTVQELVDSINSEIGLRSTEQSGYALYTDNPVGPIQHCLQTSVKVCDVIAKWEKAMQSSHQGRYESNRIIKLSYKNRLYFKSVSKSETARERYFLVYQTFDDIVHGRYPFTKDRCTKMAALMAQMEFGDRVARDNQSDERIYMILERFYPRKLKEPMTSEQRRQLKLKFLDAWQSLMGKTKQECIHCYLLTAKEWTAFGAKLFKAKQRRIVTKKRDSSAETLEDIWLAVEEDCISILDVVKMNPVFKYKYRSVVTFGGWKEDFMLVVNKTTPKGSGQSQLGTERLLFVMPRGKILEITLLIASYINAIVRQQGITFDVTCSTKKTTGASEKKIKVWDMESAEWPMLPGAGLI